MILTFPDIGPAGLIAGIFFRDLGIEYISPPSAKGTEKSGAFRSAPEDMCLPFKIFAAQLEDAWHRGADTVIMPSSAGPCRLGEFCELLRVLLKNRGCDYEWIVLDVPAAVGFRELLKRCGSILPEKWKKRGAAGSLLLRLKQIRRLLYQLESFEEKVREEAGYYEEPERAASLIASCRRELAKVSGIQEGFSVLGRFRWEQSQIKKDLSQRPVRIALTGEIFTLNEPWANLRIEDRLSDMGVCTQRDITLSWWIRRTLTSPVRNITVRYGKKRKKEFDDRTLCCEIGGYTKDSVKYASSARMRGFDGVIQILPSGCMPEIVGKAVLDRIAAEEGLRVMTLIYDETSGEAGVITRLEAFADMLERQKHRTDG